MTTLTMREEKRLEIIERVFRGELTVAKAALVLGISERQCYRINARVKKQRARGVMHGNRGRRCKSKVKEKTVKRIVELARGKYRGFNDHHLTEKLKEHEGIELSRRRCAGFLGLKGFCPPERNVLPSIAAEEREERPRG